MFLSRFAQGPAFRSGLATLMELLSDGTRFLMTITRSRAALGAEVLFLRKQLAYYQEHEIRPLRLTDAARLTLVLWSRFFHWKESLAIVTTETFIRWHRKGFKFYWRWKSRGGRPAAHGNSPAHRKYGEGERHLGRRADCLRTLVKVGHLCFSAHRGQVLA